MGGGGLLSSQFNVKDTYRFNQNLVINLLEDFCLVCQIKTLLKLLGVRDLDPRIQRNIKRTMRETVVFVCITLVTER